MNKRAKKRVKEAVRKQIAERPVAGKGQGFDPPEKKQPASRGFTPRPDKKRG
ncbi:MAG TPA: hypothetical protein VIP46_04880 [Pyrinomonadaceae bacterium]